MVRGSLLLSSCVLHFLAISHGLFEILLPRFFPSLNAATLAPSAVRPKQRPRGQWFSTSNHWDILTPPTQTRPTMPCVLPLMPPRGEICTLLLLLFFFLVFFSLFTFIFFSWNIFRSFLLSLSATPRCFGRATRASKKSKILFVS